jgi:hypothetical protein
METVHASSQQHWLARFECGGVHFPLFQNSLGRQNGLSQCPDDKNDLLIGRIRLSFSSIELFPAERGKTRVLYGSDKSRPVTFGFCYFDSP